MVTRLDVGDALTNGLDDTSTFVTQDDGEGTLGILSGESVGVCVANTSVVDLNSDFVGTRRKNLDILELQVLASSPGNGGLAGDGLSKANIWLVTRFRHKR